VAWRSTGVTGMDSSDRVIKQSLDMMQGNISEVRFGKVVEEGDKVLDVHAGIGCCTLPALVPGRAS
jgi:hypothetical protein